MLRTHNAGEVYTIRYYPAALAMISSRFSHDVKSLATKMLLDFAGFYRCNRLLAAPFLHRTQLAKDKKKKNQAGCL